MVGLRSSVALCVIQAALTAFASLAPVKLSLSSRKLAPQARAIRRRSLSTGVNVPLDDFFNGTDLQYVIPLLYYGGIRIMDYQVVWPNYCWYASSKSHRVYSIIVLSIKCSLPNDY